MWLYSVLSVLWGLTPAEPARHDPPPSSLGSADAAPQTVYLDSGRRSGIAFGRSLRIGRYDPSLPDPFMIGSWAEEARDCSNERFQCIVAGTIVLFSPIGPVRQGQSYSHMGRSARVLDCDRRNLCTIEITPSGDSASPRPLVIYFRQSQRGILSLGLEPVPGNSRSASRRFRLVGRMGLFAREEGTRNIVSH
jgi:hypothetical protein